VKKRKGIQLSLEQADEHQRKHGFPPLVSKVPEMSLPTAKKRKIRVGARKMTQTELEFQALLRAQVLGGRISDFRFEGVRLPWGDGMLFKADFAVRHLDRSITLIEVKGARKTWKHELVRFKGCRAEWKEWFAFEFWQKDSNGLWHQLA
jgi:hypothetical protein